MLALEQERSGDVDMTEAEELSDEPIGVGDF